MMMALNLRPSPVSVTTPTMIPAPAQMTATLSTPIDPPSSALKNFDWKMPFRRDRKSTRLNSSHTEIYTLSLHDALPISDDDPGAGADDGDVEHADRSPLERLEELRLEDALQERSEEHTSELQSHRDLHSFPTRRSSDLRR